MKLHTQRNWIRCRLYPIFSLTETQPCVKISQVGAYAILRSLRMVILTEKQMQSFDSYVYKRLLYLLLWNIIYRKVVNQYLDFHLIPLYSLVNISFIFQFVSLFCNDHMCFDASCNVLFFHGLFDQSFICFLQCSHIYPGVKVGNTIMNGQINIPRMLDRRCGC